MKGAMTDQATIQQPKPAGDRRLMRWILVLQLVILGWLAKNYFDGAFNRRHHNPPAVATQPDTPPSLEPSAQPNAPSPFSVLPRWTAFQRATPPPRLVHPMDRIRLEMERMMAEANRAAANFDALFGLDDSLWSALPASPAMNLRELPDAYELSLALPNTDPGSVDVQLDGRLLSVTAQQNTQTAHSTSAQRFSSRVLLPGPVAANAACQVTNENDRLCIRIPKATAPQTAARQP
ncbi:MAG: hypothetical protein BWX54_01974 [Verrucomicrobia bacterium ADurb.Bin018]|jgi:HSP20 family molecular chaperone IbpA|nr:MAG: hypothetical protein BWX54_01974 [Verrucomicrobia bacterium ADurb.Bin018]